MGLGFRVEEFGLGFRVQGVGVRAWVDDLTKLAFLKGVSELQRRVLSVVECRD